MLERSAYATTFFLAAAIGVVFVFLADLQDLYGLSDLEFGMVASAGFVAALITQLGFSPLADRGIVKPLVFLGVLSGGFGVMGFAFATDVVGLVASRAITGVGLGLFGVTARKAILGLDIEGGGRKVGTLLSSGVGGFIIGPGIGALFGSIAFELPFLVVGTAVLLVGLPSAIQIAKAPVDASPVNYGDLGQLLKAKRVQAALLVQCVIFGFIGVFDSILDRFLTDLGSSTTAVALTLIVMGSPMLFLPRLAGGLAEKRGGATVVLPGLLLMMPALALYGFAGGAVVVALLGLAHGAGESLASVSAQVMILEETGTERAAIGNAVMEATGMLTATISALVTPLIYGRFGPERLFGGTAGIGAFIALGVAGLVLTINREPEAPARKVQVPALSESAS